MNSQQFHILLKALQYGDTTDLYPWENLPPYTQFVIRNLLTKPQIYYDPSFIRSKDYYRNKHELFLDFFYFLGRNRMQRKFVQTYFFPNKNETEHWTLLLTSLVTSVVTLLYNKQTWSPREFQLVQKAIFRLGDGYTDDLRTMLVHLLDLPNELKPTEYEKEILSSKLMTPNNWGPLVWAMIHTIAECIEKNPDAAAMWKEFTIYNLHRCLPCITCSSHYQTLVGKMQHALRNDQNYSRLWFEIHNEVNRISEKALYPEEKFIKDQETLRTWLAYS